MLVQHGLLHDGEVEALFGKALPALADTVVGGFDPDAQAVARVGLLKLGVDLALLFELGLEVQVAALALECLDAWGRVAGEPEVAVNGLGALLAGSRAAVQFVANANLAEAVFVAHLDLERDTRDAGDPVADADRARADHRQAVRLDDHREQRGGMIGDAFAVSQDHLAGSAVIERVAGIQLDLERAVSRQLDPCDRLAVAHQSCLGEVLRSGTAEGDQ